MNIIELAKKAGWSELSLSMIQGCEDEKRLERFRALVLEEAAKVCDDEALAHRLAIINREAKQADTAKSCAAAIRALKGAKE